MFNVYFAASQIKENKISSYKKHLNIGKINFKITINNNSSKKKKNEIPKHLCGAVSETLVLEV